MTKLLMQNNKIFCHIECKMGLIGLYIKFKLDTFYKYKAHEVQTAKLTAEWVDTKELVS